MAMDSSKLKDSILSALRGLFWIICIIGKVILKVFVSPYRRMLQIYTLDPIEKIEKYDNQDIVGMIALVQTWRQETKKEELKGVRVASTFAAAGIIGIFSWPQITTSYWLCQGFFYLALTFSVWAIIITFQQGHLLESLPKKMNGDGSADRTLLRRMIPSEKGLRYWLMIFMWQFPTMLCSYAWVTLLVGLAVHICSPFIRRDPWGDGKKIATIYIVVASICFSVWVFTSQMVHYATKKL